MLLPLSFQGGLALTHSHTHSFSLKKISQHSPPHPVTKLVLDYFQSIFEEQSYLLPSPTTNGMLSPLQAYASDLLRDRPVVSWVYLVDDNPSRNHQQQLVYNDQHQCLNHDDFDDDEIISFRSSSSSLPSLILTPTTTGRTQPRTSSEPLLPSSSSPSSTTTKVTMKSTPIFVQLQSRA
jgi:hypothetical protein